MKIQNYPEFQTLLQHNPSMPYLPTTSKSQPQMKNSKIKAKNQNFTQKISLKHGN